MKYVYFICLLAATALACKQKALSGKELEDKLKKTMTTYLEETSKEGTEVNVKDVVYYPDKIKELYICTFTVQMRTSTSDTTGTMMALIPRDFSKVTRTQ